MTATTTTPRTSPGLTNNHMIHQALCLAASAAFMYHGALKFGDLAGGADMFGVSVAILRLVAVRDIVGPLVLLIGGALEAIRAIC